MRQTSYGIAQVLRGTPRPRDAARFLAKRVVSDTDEPGIGSAPCSRMAGSSGGGRFAPPVRPPGSSTPPPPPPPRGRKGSAGGGRGRISPSSERKRTPLDPTHQPLSYSLF